MSQLVLDFNSAPIDADVLADSPMDAVFTEEILIVSSELGATIDLGRQPQIGAE